jgi:hypothetical protein
MMELFSELDKLTCPQFAASPVRMLSREEIDRLSAAGQVTPPEQIPEYHMPRRVSMPPASRHSSFGRTLQSCRRFM